MAGAIRVPQYALPTVEARGIGTPYQSAAGATAEAFGAGAGRALERAGDKLGEWALREAARDNETAAKALDEQFAAEMRKTLFDPEKGYFTTKGKSALDGFTPAAEAISEMRKRYSAMATNDDQRRMLDGVLSRRAQDAEQSMTLHAMKQRMVWSDEVTAARVSGSIADGALWATDEKKRQLAYNTGWEEELTRIRQAGGGPDIEAEAKRKYDTRFHTAVINTRLAQDPEGAKGYFEANRASMDPVEAARLESHIKTAAEGRAALAIGRAAGGAGSAEDAAARAEAMTILRSKGWTKEQAAGIVGNLMSEGGPGLRTDARNPGDGRDGSDSIGVAQWNADRAKALKAFAASKGTDWRDRRTQIEFIQHELDTTETFARDKLKGAKTVEEAAEAFLHFERPAGYTRDNPRGPGGRRERDARARLVYGEFEADGPGPQPPPVSTYIDNARAAAEKRGLSPEGVERAISTAITTHARDAQGWKDRDDASLNGALTWADDALKSGKSIADMPNALWTALSRESKAKLTKYLNEAGNPTTVEDVYLGLKDRMVSDPAGFAAMNLNSVRHALSRSDFRSIAEAQIKAKGETTRAGLVSAEEQARAVLEFKFGLAKPKESDGVDARKKYFEAYQRLDQAWQAAEKENGKPLTAEQREKVADGLAKQVITGQSTGWFGTSDTVTSVMGGKVADVPPAERAKIEAALRAKGQAVNDTTILQLWIAAQGDREARMSGASRFVGDTPRYTAPRPGPTPGPEPAAPAVPMLGPRAGASGSPTGAER